MLNGLTGVFLWSYILLHLAGNLTIFAGPRALNLYASRLESLGPLLAIIEIGLLLTFLVHIVSAISVYVSGRRARPRKYNKTAGAGGRSHKTLASTSMIYTGVLILVFVVLHVLTFRFGAHHVVTYDGREVHDLYRIVVDVFSQLRNVIWYEVIMVLLGLHLRHGFWSSFQSLGLEHPKYSPLIETVGVIFALVIAVGFLAIPPFIYFTGGVQ